jgi:hypothetical protein
MSTWISARKRKLQALLPHPGKNDSRKTAALSILLAVLLVGCRGVGQAVDDIAVGQTRAEVRQALGDPDRTDEFPLPEAATFGPVEELDGKVPVGQPVEEWVYERGEDELYIWFAGQSGQEPAQWTVIHFAVYPAGAVY